MARGAPAVTKLAFVDTETTGLNFDVHEVWEVGLVVRGSDVRGEDGEYRWFLNTHRLHLADPFALNVGGFHERYKAALITPAYDFGPAFCKLTASAVWVGCNPMFDIRMLEPLTRDYVPSWHYRPICAESLAVGHLMAEAWEHGGGRVPVPWSNHKDIAPRLGVELTDEHTALGDARYAAALYDAVMMTR